jgi:phosphoglycolate phosphatase-like HAD superfamily hydrolase
LTAKSEIRKVLLFDLDWTLIYTGGAGVRALDHAFEKLFGIPQAMKKVTPDGKTDPAICREMIRVHLNREPQGAEINSLCQGYLDRLAEEVPQGPGYRVLPGIPELLQALSETPSVLMGLGTGNLEEGARIKLARADLMKYFRFGGYGSDSEDRPTVLRTAVKRGEALAKTTFAPEDVVVIGDNIRDVQAGQAIGAVTVAVASGPMSYGDLSASKPDHLFRDFSDTRAVLKVLSHD